MTGTNKIFSISILLLTLFILSCKDYTSNQINPKKYGSFCKMDRECDSIVGINCNAEVDGPYYYVNKYSGDVISKCGGFCLTSDPEQIKICQTQCPPKEWKC